MAEAPVVKKELDGAARTGAEPAKYRAKMRSVLEKHNFVVAMRNRSLIEKWQKSFQLNAESSGCGYWLDTKTWRASADWAKKLGMDINEAWEAIVNDALGFRARNETDNFPIIISGVVGPRRDGYRIDPTVKLTIEDAKAYHKAQVDAFTKLGTDCVTVYTMNHMEEAAGICLACKEANMPVVISFTVETDGKLASGEALASAVKRVDELSDEYPLFYMINCAHPSHMKGALNDTYLCSRLGGLFPNSSKKSHAELDESTELDPGDAKAIGGELMALCEEFKFKPKVVGGCCGTCLDHVSGISKSFTGH